MRFVVRTYPGFALGRQDDDRQLPTDALFKNDAIYIHVHPLVELAPLAVLRPEVVFDVLRDLVERKSASPRRWYGECALWAPA